MLSGLTDQGVRESAVHPVSHKLETRRTVCASSEEIKQSLTSFRKWLSEVRTNERLITTLSSWLMSKLLFLAFECFTIFSLLSLEDMVSRLPLLEKLLLRRRDKLLSAMGSPPLIFPDSIHCEFHGGKMICLDQSVTELLAVRAVAVVNTALRTTTVAAG